MSRIGRNEPCHCGSGRKYKKCCLAKDEEARFAALTAAAPSSARETETPKEDFEAHEAEPSPADERCWEDEEDETPPDGDVYMTDAPVLYPTYPKPPKDLPALSPEANRLVDEWWDTAKPFFVKTRNADAMLLHLTNFMDRHPALVVHLELEHEYLFELGAEFGRRREWSRYADLLLRLREQHPEAYVRGFDYFDYDVIIEQLARGRAKDVPRFFNYFHQYPTSRVDNNWRLIELMAWTGLQDALFEFVKPLPPPPEAAPDAVGFSISPEWLALAQYVPFLDARADPATAARELVEAINHLLVRDSPHQEEDFVAFELRRCLEPPAIGDFRACRSRSDVQQFYHGVAWNFRGFLHASRGFPWTRSHFLAEALEPYWRRRAEGGKPREPFPFDAQDIETFVCKTCRDFTVINGVCAASFIEASWHFADYLRACGLSVESERDRACELCADLFRRSLPTFDSTDPVPRLMPEFPTMKIDGL